MTEETTNSTEEGTTSNTVVGTTPTIEPQTPDQFYTGEPDEDEKVDPAHATEGMTTFGYTEASRIENTAAIQEAERDAAEAAAKPAEKSSKK